MKALTHPTHQLWLTSNRNHVLVSSLSGCLCSSGGNAHKSCHDRTVCIISPWAISLTSALNKGMCILCLYTNSHIIYISYTTTLSCRRDGLIIHHGLIIPCFTEWCLTECKSGVVDMRLDCPRLGLVSVNWLLIDALVMAQWYSLVPRLPSTGCWDEHQYLIWPLRYNHILSWGMPWPSFYLLWLQSSTYSGSFPDWLALWITVQFCCRVPLDEGSLMHPCVQWGY